MIIYGSRATEIGSELVNDKCPNCGTQNSVQLTVFQKYAHVFWIPFFPMGKSGATVCSHCKQVVEEDALQGIAKSTCESLKSRSKAPIWTFSGLALLAILITWLVISDKQDKTRYAQLLDSPQTGDVYEIKLDSKQYTLYKVANVSGDTVFVMANQYETNKITGLSDIQEKGNDAYSPETAPLLKSDLKSMFEKGEIMGVKRN